MLAQSSIEMLALTVLFMTLLLPILVYMFSSSSQTSKLTTFYSVKSALSVIKYHIENAYAYCPYKNSFRVTIPTEVVDLYVEGNFLVASYGEGQIAERLFLDNSNVHLDVKGRGYQIPLVVECIKGYFSEIYVRDENA